MEQKPNPTWHLEAEQRGLDYLVVLYEKAEGFIFCPRNLEYPFRVGGDYDGNLPIDARGVVEYLATDFNPHFLERIKWFIPYVQKVANGEDFSLENLKIEQRGLRIISGRWPW